jgi:isoquinoline 1-oxidoreductase beta subunit
VKQAIEFRPSRSSFVSYTAVVLSVVPDPVRTFRVDEAWISMDAGTIVNEERVHAQLEGGVIMGISNAIFGGVTMKKGRTVESNFRDARIARIRDVPRLLHTDIVASNGPHAASANLRCRRSVPRWRTRCLR